MLHYVGAVWSVKAIIAIAVSAGKSTFTYKILSKNVWTVGAMRKKKWLFKRIDIFGEYDDTSQVRWPVEKILTSMSNDR